MLEWKLIEWKNAFLSWARLLLFANLNVEHVVLSDNHTAVIFVREVYRACCRDSSEKKIRGHTRKTRHGSPVMLTFPEVCRDKSVGGSQHAPLFSARRCEHSSTFLVGRIQTFYSFYMHLTGRLLVFSIPQVQHPLTTPSVIYFDSTFVFCRLEYVV